MHRFLLILLLFVSTPVFSQLDDRKLDSLSRAIDARHRSVRKWQDSFTRQQRKPVAAPKAADRKEDPAGYRIWIIAGVLLVAGLLLARRTKRSS